MKKENFAQKIFFLLTATGSVALAISATEFTPGSRKPASELSSESALEVIYPKSVNPNLRNRFFDAAGLGRFVKTLSDSQKDLLLKRLENLPAEQVVAYYPEIPPERITFARARLSVLP